MKSAAFFILFLALSAPAAWSYGSSYSSYSSDSEESTQKTYQVSGMPNKVDSSKSESVSYDQRPGYERFGEPAGVDLDGDGIPGEADVQTGLEVAPIKQSVTFMNNMGYGKTFSDVQPVGQQLRPSVFHDLGKEKKKSGEEEDTAEEENVNQSEEQKIKPENNPRVLIS